MKKNTILVTGGCGFIGSNFIIKQLQSNENIIVNVDKLTYAGNPDNLKSVNSNKSYHFFEGDIKSKNFINDIFDNYNIDGLINFAAESHVDRSIDGPIDFVNTNILGTANLLECSRTYLNNKNIDHFRFIHVSTDEVYGSLGETGYFTEKTPYDPKSPYSASKASSDHLVNAWFHTYGLPTIITNCSNNYGPYQFPEKLIPLIIMNCLNEKDLPIYGDGQNVRDWLYVEDHCNAINKIYSNGKIGQTYNIGGNNEITNLDIVHTICDLMDEFSPRKNKISYKDLITFVKDRPGHDFRYAIDATKIKNELNWIPSENFNSGIRKTVKWYLENKVWYEKIKYNQKRLGVSQ